MFTNVYSLAVKKKWILLATAATSFLGLAACGGNNANVQNSPPPPASTPVSIFFQPAPPQSINQNVPTTLTAVVSNDASQEGVDWALLCPSNANCGSLSALHTASGSPVTYTPSSVNSASVTIEAFATADHTKNVFASLNIVVVGFENNLKGNYVFETAGVDANGGPFQLAGVIALDGTGKITGGEQTHSDFVLSVSDSITGGSYMIGQDGRGTITLNTADQNIGQLGVENLSLVFLSSSKVLIETLDDPNLQPSNETSSGTMELQSSTAGPTGGYAFAVNGTDLNLNPLAMGGVMNIDSANTISGAGSVADQDLAGSLFPKASLSGNTTTPDAFGSLQFNLTTDFAPTPLIFTGYIVDATHIKLIESDNDGSGSGFGATGGVAIGQGTATGTFTNQASFAGNYVFSILGQDLTGLPTSLASVGTFTADATGKLTAGFNDEYLSGFSVAISNSFTGTYTLDASGDGRVDSTITYQNNGPGPDLIFYLTGNGSPPLVLDADSSIGSVGAGIAYPQASPPFSFNGPYGLSYTQGAFGSEDDGAAQINVDGTAMNLSGIVDTNFLFSSLPDTTITGTFGTISSNGRSDGTLTNTFFPSPSTPNTIAVAYYFVDSAHGFFTETDSTDTGELLLGYFEMRTPLCSACPR